MKKISFKEATNFKNRQKYTYFSAFIKGDNVKNTIFDKFEILYSDNGNLNKKIQNKHKLNSFKCNLVGKIRKIGFNSIGFYDIYRIEILDDNGNIIDAINTHKDGVPKEIREEFDKQFRNKDGTDKIIPLKED